MRDVKERTRVLKMACPACGSTIIPKAGCANVLCYFGPWEGVVGGGSDAADFDPLDYTGVKDAQKEPEKEKGKTGQITASSMSSTETSPPSNSGGQG